MSLDRGHQLAAEIAGTGAESKPLIDDEERSAELLQAILFPR
jgi:hypothetical protein